MPLAAVRNDIADFVASLITVYTIILIAYILTQLYFGFGGRMPYSRAGSGIIGFLRDVSEPYLAIFRRFIPPIGPLDLSPMVGILLLQIVGGIVVAAIDG